jgi:hypothetical protein
MNYNVIVYESNPSHYQITAGIIVIHRRIISLQGITTLGNTPKYIIILAEMHTDLHQSRRSASSGEGSSFPGNHQSRRSASASVDSISLTILELRNETL